MGDWNRTDRDNDRNQYRGDDRQNRGGGSWGQQGNQDRQQGRYGNQDDDQRFSSDQNRSRGGAWAQDQDQSYDPLSYGDRGDHHRSASQGGFSGQGYRAGSGDWNSQGGNAQDRNWGPQGQDYQAGSGNRSFGQRSGYGSSQEGRSFGSGAQNQAGEHRGRGPQNYTRSDERIRDDVNDRLTDDSWLDASQISVEVSNGEVTLNGTVKSRDDKRRAEDVAEAVSGIKHVQNNLRVQQAGAQQGSSQTTMGGSSQQGKGNQTSAAQR